MLEKISIVQSVLLLLTGFFPTEAIDLTVYILPQVVLSIARMHFTCLNVLCKCTRRADTEKFNSGHIAQGF